MNLAEPATFDRIYREHRRAVFLTAMRITKDPALAEDVTHDVFVRLWRRPARFDDARGELGPYLRLMARSRALDLWRERQAAGRAQDRLVVAAGIDPEPQPDDPSMRAVAGERAATVREALHELPEPQREALVLAYWGGLTAEEIARRIGVPLGTVKSRIRLGLAKLRTSAGGLLPEAGAELA
ncbi:MAG: sigma-70 family RNA polymerase sigma factor [Solirubrobacteraceae bacterium]|nr:sigma-70 family RNA polymerase sigma factor [Solirubrobacteraceae bacterium]